ncbi:molybdopterin-dependent oxidoreductase [Plantactinospora sp. KLBMP9567]|uniref:molybdopterin-dependent oxidoreductase n=1 Tax=Plantactinospora sp. KLBMP9567 TaxID=3085900 RepID=UPI0029812D7A|nr:molybdopterin-dependent oxidoreductase [Plantactinospora sp. KLBMP9567]MDW5324529.1 molybdopterin-dependent oxidoreductase [Plantactinospora sp. KLBMP9567]
MRVIPDLGGNGPAPTVPGRHGGLPRRFGALAGLAAAAVAVGAAEAVAVLTGARSAPLVAVGGVVVDLAPAPLKRFAVDVFYVYDKIALLVGTAVLLAGFAALVGLVAVRSLPLGYAGIALFGAVGVLAALTRPGAGPVAVLPSLVGAVLAAGVLRLFVAGPLGRALIEPAGATGPVPAGTAPSAAAYPDEYARRRFLTGVGLAVGAAGVGGFGGRWLSTRRGVSAARAAIELPLPASPAAQVPPNAELAVPGLSPYVTPNRDFYRIDTALVVPRVDPDGWQLRIHGRVRNPITLSYADLLARPMIERHITLACVSNEVGGDLIGNARWLGVPLGPLLAEAGPLPGADQVVARSTDGWTCGSPTEVLTDGRDAMLAVGMNGEPLPIEHGFPVRVVVPGLYGYVSACKWLVELELTSFADFDAYWVPRGWSARGPIKTQSRIDIPRTGRTVPAGEVTVAGVAWAQHVGIRQVEVRVDDGDWQPATLAGSVSTDTWTQWSWRWPATPGEHVLQVRATDADGAVQTGQSRPVEPDGATGWHTVRVTVT